LHSEVWFGALDIASVADVSACSYSETLLCVNVGTVSERMTLLIFLVLFIVANAVVSSSGSRSKVGADVDALHLHTAANSSIPHWNLRRIILNEEDRRCGSLLKTSQQHARLVENTKIFRR